MRVSLRQPAPINSRPGRIGAELCPHPLLMLHAEGPRVTLGGHQGVDGLAVPVRPRPETLFGPRGACLAGKNGPLFVADTGHHRLMIWPNRPERDDQPAEMLIGQPDFSSEGRNAKGAVCAATLNVPAGVAAVDGILTVADAWNHRVLIWHGFPCASNQPADVVLGQADFTGGLANRGADAPNASTLNWCYGVTIADGRLFVADTGNRRVLMWDRVPERNGAPADLVLGQADFICRDENAGQGIGALGMRWPHAVVLTDGALTIADAGNNRIMVWRRLPRSNGVPCDFVLGQAGHTHQEYNAAAYFPTAATVNMPYGLARLGGRLVVADTANSRLIGYDLDGLAMGAAATALAGQRRFADKGDNRWAPTSRDSLCWPYGIASCGRTLVVADSGNNRVLLWEAAS
jgi:hypothetical protein